ncbi:transcriptional regulator [Vitreoscilla filiformis]|uniref:Transcriptional regulator n=1 Tax=Vitreoscilla filiformis TaxID=63 RepID=A0A221KHT7_VITFI|nr:LysR family transcriptional regulator [Vitreoscilla filiformis]ASM78360.1 transcriptional regulator [Vitreoscilla filiformis]
MDKLTALQTFCMVVEKRSFSGAAIQLGLSRSAVSKNIRELEEYLGVTLIRRSTRHVSITDEGEIYYDRVQHLLTQMRNTDDFLRSSGTTLSGKLRISVPMSLGLTCLIPLILEFRARHPDITLDLMLSDEKVDLLAQSYDVAIRGSTQKLTDANIMMRTIGQFDHVLCASPVYLADRQSPLSPQDLVKHNCLSYSNSGIPTRWEFENAGHQCGVTINASINCNNSLALRYAALQGLGIVRIPEVIVREDIAAGRLQPVMTSWRSPCVKIFVLYPCIPSVPRRLRAFIDFLAQRFNHRNAPDVTVGAVSAQ